MKLSRLCIIVFVSCMSALLHAADAHYVVIKNEHDYPIKLFISRISENAKSEDPTVDAGKSRRIENIITVRQIGFKGSWDTDYTQIDLADPRQHPHQDLEVTIKAPYSKSQYPLTGGYGPWKVTQRWYDIKKDHEELASEFEELVEDPLSDPQAVAELFELFRTHQVEGKLYYATRELRKKYLDRIPFLSQKRKEDILNMYEQGHQIK